MIGTAALILTEDGEINPFLIANGYLLTVSIDGAWHEAEDTFDFQNFRLYKLGQTGYPEDLKQTSQIYGLPKVTHKAALLCRMLAYMTMHQESLSEAFKFSEVTMQIGPHQVRFVEVDVMDLRDFEGGPQIQIHIHETHEQAKEIIHHALKLAANIAGLTLPDNCVRRESLCVHGKSGYIGAIEILNMDRADRMLRAIKSFLSSQVIEIEITERKTKK